MRLIIRLTLQTDMVGCVWPVFHKDDDPLLLILAGHPSGTDASANTK